LFSALYTVGVEPPSMRKVVPVRKSVSGLARKQTAGLAYVGEWMVADDIASGRLVEVLSEWTPSYPGYCLYYPGRRHMATSLRALVDLAKEIVFRNRAAS
jgi:DNA-binding transcriptional LysR family regulator